MTSRSIFVSEWPDAAVYDVTVAYSTRSFPQTELDILSGLFPSSVHFDVRRYALALLPDEPALIDAWCRALWASKERRLHAFCANLSFDTATTSGKLLDILVLLSPLAL